MNSVYCYSVILKAILLVIDMAEVRTMLPQEFLIRASTDRIKISASHNNEGPNTTCRK